MADDNILRVGAEFDVGPIISGSQQASTSIDAFAARLKAAGLTAEETASALVNLDVSQKDAAEAAGMVAEASQRQAAAQTDTISTSSELASAISLLAAEVHKLAEANDEVGASGERAAGGMRGMAGGAAMARVEMGALSGSAGAVEMGLARLAGQSATLAPLISAAFVPFAIVAFLEIFSQVAEAFDKAIDNVVGYTKAVQDAEKEDVKFSQAAEGQAHTLNEAHQKLAATVKESGDLANETFNEKWVKAMENATHATSAFWAGLSDPLIGFTALFNAEEGPANRVAQLGKNLQALTKDTYDLTIAQDRNNISLLQAKAARDEAGLATRAQQLQVELNLLSQKAALEENIARNEEAKKGGGAEAQNQASAVVAQEAAYKRQQLLAQQAMDVQKETADFNAEQLVKSMAEWERADDEFQALAAEQSNWTTTQSVKDADAQNKIITESIAKELELRQTAANNNIRVAEESSVKAIEIEEARSKAQNEIRQTQIAVASATNPFQRIQTVAAANAQELSEMKSFEAEKLAAQVKALQDQQVLLQGGQSLAQFAATTGEDSELVAKWRDLQDKIVAIKADAAAKIAALDNQSSLNAAKAAEQQQQVWDRATRTITQDFERTFDGVFRGTESVRFAFIKVAGDIVLSMAHSLEQMLIKWVATQLEMTIAHIAAKETQVAATASAAAQTKAIEGPLALASIEKSAAKAAAAAYASASEVPIIGPILGPIAAAGAFAGVMAFGILASAEQGAIIPRNMPVNLHEGEMVLPPKISGAVQQMAAAGAGGRFAGDTHIHLNALDGQSTSGWLRRNQGVLISGVRGAIRNRRL